MTRQTFTVPDGAEPVLDAEGRATGEVTTTPNHEADAGVRVKPLEWQRINQTSSVEIAQSVLGNYYVDDSAWSAATGPFYGCTDRAAGKAAAQAHYERRIRSALLPIPAPAAPEPETGVSGEDDLARRLRHTCDVAEAFLRHFNVFDLAEDKSQQWQSLHHEVELSRAALSASHRAHPGREEIRNEALEEAAKVEPEVRETYPFQQAGFSTGWSHALAAKRSAIRSLKSHSIPPTSSKVATDDTLDGMAGQ